MAGLLAGLRVGCEDNGAVAVKSVDSVDPFDDQSDRRKSDREVRGFFEIASALAAGDSRQMEADKKDCGMDRPTNWTAGPNSRGLLAKTAATLRISSRRSRPSLDVCTTLRTMLERD
jgi:hypothetical protein